jgi:hypothetical protein
MVDSSRIVGIEGGIYMVIEPNKVSKPITVEFVLDVPTWSEDDNFCEPDCVEFIIKRRHNRVVVLKEHVKEKQVALLNDRKSYLLNVSPTGKNKMTLTIAEIKDEEEIGRILYQEVISPVLEMNVYK